MDENMYDEFGNYIGPDIPEVEEDIFIEEYKKRRGERKPAPTSKLIRV